jgi:UDP-N-acetylmuramate--alanine ligase
MPVDLSTPHRIHLVGVGGSGMNAIAAVLAEMGHTVSGSDLRDSIGLDRLRALGVEVHVGHAAAHVEGAELVAVSTAIPETNPEVRAARDSGRPVLRRAEILAAIAALARTVGVAGTHGKTTTSSMLALVLAQAGLSPSFIIGGDVNEIGSGAVWGDGEWFVVEADESDGTFLALGAEVTVVTNVEPDHLEHWGGFGPLREAFASFTGAGSLGVVCADDPGAASLPVGGRRRSYGTAAEADVRMVERVVDGGGCRFHVVVDGEDAGWFELPVAGHHNALNALGAIAAALELGATADDARVALARYGGVARRFEHRGRAGGVTFVDDYAHLPTEVSAAIAAAREHDPGRLVVVFQPHRYSRTASVGADFADAFTGADLLAITDVYPAGEPVRPGVSGMVVVRAVLDEHPYASVAYLPTLSDVEAWLLRTLRPGDLCLTLGAGDLTALPDRVVEAMQQPVEAAP